MPSSSDSPPPGTSPVHPATIASPHSSRISAPASSPDNREEGIILKPLHSSLLRPRPVTFDYGLMPIPKLIFPESALAQTLSQPKEKRVGAAMLAEALQIPPDQVALALGMFAAVLPAEDHVLVAGGGGGADLRDVLLFLYIQCPHKDSPQSPTSRPPPPRSTATFPPSPRSRVCALLCCMLISHRLLKDLRVWDKFKNI